MAAARSSKGLAIRPDAPILKKAPSPLRCLMPKAVVPKGQRERVADDLERKVAEYSRQYANRKKVSHRTEKRFPPFCFSIVALSDTTSPFFPGCTQLDRTVSWIGFHQTNVGDQDGAGSGSTGSAGGSSRGPAKPAASAFFKSPSAAAGATATDNNNIGGPSPSSLSSSSSSSYRSSSSSSSSFSSSAVGGARLPSNVDLHFARQVIPDAQIMVIPGADLNQQPMFVNSKQYASIISRRATEERWERQVRRLCLLVCLFVCRCLFGKSTWVQTHYFVCTPPVSAAPLFSPFVVRPTLCCCCGCVAAAGCCCILACWLAARSK